MPKIEFNGSMIHCSNGENLRSVLMRHKLGVYKSAASILNCRGLGTCGTCAVEVQGEVSPKTKVEKWRLNFPPHNEANGLRLACQCTVLGDLTIKKYDGFWGEKI